MKIWIKSEVHGAVGGRSLSIYNVMGALIEKARGISIGVRGGSVESSRVCLT